MTDDFDLNLPLDNKRSMEILLNNFYDDFMDFDLLWDIDGACLRFGDPRDSHVQDPYERHHVIVTKTVGDFWGPEYNYCEYGEGGYYQDTSFTTESLDEIVKKVKNYLRMEE